MIELVWACFDAGHYTHDESMYLLTHPELHQFIPIKGELLIDLCTELVNTLGKGH